MRHGAIDVNGTVWGLPVPLVKFKRTHPDAKLPTYAKDGDAGMDIYSVEDVIIFPGETTIVDVGFNIELGIGWECQARSRSGNACKGLVVANSPGTIDSGYRGAVKIILHNNNLPSAGHDHDIKIKKGDRVAQFVVVPCYRAIIQEVDELSQSERGTGGFGSTGK